MKHPWVYMCYLFCIVPILVYVLPKRAQSHRLCVFLSLGSFGICYWGLTEGVKNQNKVFSFFFQCTVLCLLGIKVQFISLRIHLFEVLLFGEFD